METTSQQGNKAGNKKKKKKFKQTKYQEAFCLNWRRYSIRNKTRYNR